MNPHRQMSLPGLLPPDAVAAAPGRTWLSAEAALFDALLTSPRMAAVLQEAALACVGREGRGSLGEAFEQAVADRLTRDAVAEISAETAERAPETTLGRLTDLELIHVPGKRAVDLWVVWHTELGVHRSAANLKRAAAEASDQRQADAVSLKEFLYNLTEPGLDQPWEKPCPKGWNHSRAILEQAAGLRRIQRGRSYTLIVAVIDANGIVVERYAHSLAGHVDAYGQLPLMRNPLRDGSVMTVGKPARTLPAGFDVNAALATALLAPRDMDGIRERILGNMGSNAAERRDVAARLLALPDDQLLRAVARVLI